MAVAWVSEIHQVIILLHNVCKYVILGFLYMDTHDTTLITEVQYLAPLMAYFSSQMDENSKIYTLDDGR